MLIKKTAFNVFSFPAMFSEICEHRSWTASPKYLHQGELLSSERNEFAVLCTINTAWPQCAVAHSKSSDAKENHRHSVGHAASYARSPLPNNTNDGVSAAYRHVRCGRWGSVSATPRRTTTATCAAVTPIILAFPHIITTSWGEPCSSCGLSRHFVSKIPHCVGTCTWLADSIIDLWFLPGSEFFLFQDSAL